MIHPDDNGENGVIGIKPKALLDMEYLKWVIAHELIHLSVGEELDMKHNHSGLFDKIADELGLPEKYRK
jgi:predicted metal-dependent hydrolase